jgi:exosome complex RNA-binding protein Rrp42 (RNase PH superfamily)
MRQKVIANCTRSLAKGGANRGIRLGARPLSHFRNVRVLFGKSYGHCEVVFEPGTKVYAQVRDTLKLIYNINNYVICIN